MSSVPNRPSGSSRQARWCQWVHDSIMSALRVKPVRGAKVSQTTGGTFIEPIETGTGQAGSRVKQYLLTDASNGDYFICRTLSQTADPETETIDLTIGSSDVLIAKPFHLRQTPFDREALNVDDPGAIGTVDEITYDVLVEAWNGVTFSSSTKKLSFEYKSATFRVATDETEADPDDWTEQNQTIIPRFVPAVLVEEEDEPVTSTTITPTIIYAINCSGIVCVEDSSLPAEDQTLIDVRLLALNDGWAWAKTS